MTRQDYVHGYSVRENERLLDQANTLAELLHHDTLYPKGALVLEAGCGVGAQTVILAQNNPKTQFISVDISPASVEAAQAAVAHQGISNVSFRTDDILNLSFEANYFDHIFVCFVLEHLQQPLAALQQLKRVLKPGGTLTVIEGDHASAYFYPDSEYAQRAIACLIELQASMGGNSLIGRQLYPLLKQAGFQNIRVTPRQVYVDSSRPEWVEGFTKNTFTAMVAGAKEQALQQKLIDLKTWEQGITDLYATAEENGTFNYTFFKAIAVK
ncbi:methyltransferase domain-containing protein [Leptolyngbya sp. FACHB-541]|uniref:methyltransferase domain-containing protein n=1 Tax=Leptolyngbya sp. FACHB-541 TaxID=2692810 RepID=UPI001683D726|nr:class I SAM-dependent methyltransferase [Leptolyngbya sp. FACHB-541]MBD1995588.1 methyltransferase domain-containing protein [Leptolyngbya sp. FACHB-541]